MQKLFTCITAICIFLLVSLSLSGISSADLINLDTAFSNYSPGDPDYIGDYGTVEIIQNGANVDFAISTGSDLGLEADLQYFYFNTIENISGLIMYAQSPVPPAGSLSYSFNSLNNYYKPDGDGYFDGVISFGNGSPTLNSVTVTLAADNALSIGDFMAVSVGGNKGAFTVAAHWQTSGTPDGSEFVGGNPVPIPGAVWLLGSGFIGCIGFRKKMKR